MTDHDFVNYIMGVSLGNRTFTRDFAEHLFSCLAPPSRGHLEILLCDTLETINFRVRRNMSHEYAKIAARAKASELRDMFINLSRGNDRSLKVVLESQSGYRQLPQFNLLLAEIQKAYKERAKFFHDVNDQVRLNLVNVRKSFLEAHLEELSEYVQEELALFYTYFSFRPEVVEIYPGPNLYVKEQLFSGAYLSEIPHGTLTHIPRFIDLSKACHKMQPSSSAA